MTNKNSVRVRHFLTTGLAAAVLLGLSATPVSAGEITGNGKWIAGSEDEPLKGRSACAYSGRQDNYAEDEGFFRSMIVQSWGQIPKPLRDMLATVGAHPGDACNPSGKRAND